MIWYIQNGIPLNISYLEACMRQADHLKTNDSLNRNRLLELLDTKIGSLDWESAKSDMRPFIADPERLNIWSPQFFSSLIQQLKIE